MFLVYYLSVGIVGSFTVDWIANSVDLFGNSVSVFLSNIDIFSKDDWMTV